MRTVGWLLLLVACGGTDDEAEEAELSPVRQACEDYCFAVADGEGCDAAAVEGKCDDFCVFAGISYPAECEDLAIAYFDCESGTAHTCDGYFVLEIGGVAMPLPDEDTCDDALSALNDCASGTTM